MHQSPDVFSHGILIYPYNGNNISEKFKWDERVAMEVRTINLNAPGKISITIF